jgi:hypothetical protein
MILPMAKAPDWATISSLATAGGTLVLAVATFAAVRSSNRSARIAEIALQEQRRPILAPSRFDDPMQKIMFVERKWVRAGGGRGVAEHEDGTVYLALSLRNVGAGMGVCQGWAATGGLQTSRADHRDLDEFHTQLRDLYIPTGDVGMWQGALRDRSDPDFATVVEAIETGEPITIELLYSDQVGDQRTITRFGLTPYADPESGDLHWLTTATRHWYLDRDSPRSESERLAAAEAFASQREAEAAEASAEPSPTT